MKPHPLAKIFQRLPEEQLRELALSIEADGLQEPIVTYEGKILDGLNRQEACLRAGREPRYVEWNGKGSPVRFVLAKNLWRRHLNESQRALVAATFLEQLEKEARARAKADVSVPRGTPGRAAAVAGRTAHVSARSVARAKRVLEEAPKKAVDAIRAGDKTLGQVERELKRATQVEQAKAYVPPVGEWPVISIDPPWRYEDELDGSDRARGGTPYPTMSIEEIAALELPVAQDAAVFLWVTNSHLIDPEAYAFVADTWHRKYELEPKGICTWEKANLGLGHYFRNITEHLVLLVRGKPVFTEEKPRSHFRAPVGEHSEKPAAAYMVIERFCAAQQRLEMFARAPRPGWATSGSELGPPPMFIDTPAGKAAVAAINAGMQPRPPHLPVGWIEDGGAFSTEIDGIKYYVQQPNGSMTWEWHRPKQRGNRQLIGGGYSTAQDAMNQAEFDGTVLNERATQARKKGAK